MTLRSQAASIRHWLAEPLPRDVKLAIERLARTDDVRRIVVLPDVHLAEDVCIGTVMATRRLIYPDAVGGDIGCGMAAIRFECGADVLADERDAARLLAGLYRQVPAIRHSSSTAVKALPEPLAADALTDPRLEKLKPRDGRVEFATLGRGNHFLEFQTDDAGSLWLMVHSGSRAMGQAIREIHLEGARESSTGLRFIDAEEESGQAYLADLAWACRYAEESRRALAAAAAELVSKLFSAPADPASFISCHHNHVRRETHSGETLWIHRKGAIPAAAGEAGIIPGSMGTSSYHVEGRGSEEALASSSHGAGRAMSRSRARRRICIADLHREMRGVWFDHRLGEALRDEAPSAYKDITAVMRAQGDLTRIVRRLRPVLCYKGT
jgi:tRNA-splicing ligase RtcB